MRVLAGGLVLGGAVWLVCGLLLALARTAPPQGSSLLAISSIIDGPQPGVYLTLPDGDLRGRVNPPDTSARRAIFADEGLVLYFDVHTLNGNRLWRYDLRTGARRDILAGHNLRLTGWNLSPDGRWLLLQQYSRPESRIWRVPTAGDFDDAALVLRAESGALVLPTWSPDSAWLAYAEGIGTQRYVYRKLAVGGAPHRLASHPDLMTNTPVAWSPEGDRLAYVTQNRGDAAIIVHQLPTDQQTRYALPSTNSVIAWWPASPDWLYFLGRRSPRSISYFRLHLSTPAQPPQDLLWSPGGALGAPGWLYFSSENLSVQLPRGVYRMRPNGTDPERV
ncbi:MAG: hypothetical protein ACLFTK_17810, partial [Anaerolineales bacterium]